MSLASPEVKLGRAWSASKCQPFASSAASTPWTLDEVIEMDLAASEVSIGNDMRCTL